MKITQIFRLDVNALDVKVHALDVEITFLSNDPQSSSSSSSLSVPSWADEIAKDIITITRGVKPMDQSQQQQQQHDHETTF